MNKIPSFTIDHLRLQRGVYVSRRDKVGTESLTTFDIRMKAPNREKVLDAGASHSLEHLAATFLRNHPQWKDRIIYWGPMGCLTGFYLIVEGEVEPLEIRDLLIETFRFIADFEGEVPGATPRDCGNAALHDKEQARLEAARFLDEVLEHLGPDNTVYP